MSFRAYTEALTTRRTPQSEAIPGTSENSAGGYSFKVDDWVRLDRFLILGSEGGSYYASERKLTVENAEAVKRCIAVNGVRTVNRVAEISDSGRAPKNDPAIFALAMALKLGDESTRRLARLSVSRVCRIGTHIFQLAEAVKALGGWGRNTKAAFARWYQSQSLDQLAMNLIKYQSREGWSHRDLLRKTHVKPSSAEHTAMLRWAVGKEPDKIHVNNLIRAFEILKGDPRPAKAVELITHFGLPRECVPTELLNSPEVWEALLMSGRGMPITAMIRNLGKMSEIGLLKPLSRASKYVVERLAHLEGLRVHPIQILLAQSVYAAGHGVRGSLSWTPVGPVVDALNDAFYMAFKVVEPADKRWLLALDVSGSMDSGTVAGTPLTPREASAAMALVIANTEKQHHIVGFTSSGSGYGGKWDGDSSGLSEISISPKTRLDEACQIVRDLPYGGTDCALPVIYALSHKLEVDAFVVLTDSETWAGRIHPVQALREYRQKMGIPARLIVVGMVSNQFSIADPSDAGMLDVVGFDSNAPAVMADFARG